MMFSDAKKLEQNLSIQEISVQMINQNSKNVLNTIMSSLKK